MPRVDTVGAGAALRFDVAIIGAGVAGLVTALDLRDRRPHARIAIIDKGALGESGSTPLAQGGMAAAVGPDDSPALHAADTIRAGDGLCDPRAVAVMAAEGPQRVRDLERRGAAFDRDGCGGYALAREGGQTVHRSVRRADATGAEIFRALRTAVATTGGIVRLQGVVCALASDGGPERRALGAWVLLDGTGGSVHGAGLALVRADATVLATGGCGGLYGATTNRDGATADGVALAAAAGAQLVDLEFVQFHPTGLMPAPGTATGSWRLLLTEALRGAGARLVDRDGHRFMPDRHPDAELAPRHVVTKAILDQPGGAWLDATLLDAEQVAVEFPTVADGVRRYGYDLSAAPVPVEPAQHYMIGGVATDLWGRTSVPGLHAVGEVACTGVHGANRMAGNSLLQSCVFAHRSAAMLDAELDAAASAADHVAEPDAPPLQPQARAVDLATVRGALRAAMSAGAGPVRSAAGLAMAAAALDTAGAALDRDAVAVTPDRDAVELAHLVTAGRLIVRSAQLRTESRGVHWRDDHPASEPAWSGVRLRVQESR